jgi:hypothetical protein
MVRWKREEDFEIRGPCQIFSLHGLMVSRLSERVISVLADSHRGRLATYILIAVALTIVTSLAVAEPPANDPATKPETLSDIVKETVSNSRQLGLACKLFAMDHGGLYPPLLMHVYPDYIAVKTIFTCPLCLKEQIGYAYFGGKDSDPPKQVLLYSKAPTAEGKWVVIHNDLTYELVAEEPKQPEAPAKEPESKGVPK